MATKKIIATDNPSISLRFNPFAPNLFGPGIEPQQFFAINSPARTSAPQTPEPPGAQGRAPAAVNSRKEFQAAVSFGSFLCTKEKNTAYNTQRQEPALRSIPALAFMHYNAT
jgi:hypothetical protein